MSVLLVLFIALVVRLPYGFDWTDESYYSVLPYRYVLGDRPIVDTWEVHQFSGMIALPLLRVFLLCSGGGTEGVMMYFRWVYIVLQLLVSLYAFFVLRRKSGDAPALLAAGMLLMHTHYAINSLHYNTMALLFVTLSALLCFDAQEGRGTVWKALLGGAAFALSVLAYPYLAVASIVYAVYWRALARRLRKQEKRLRAPLAFLGGIVLLAAAFCVFVFSRATLSEVLANVPYLFADPDHESTSVLRTLASFFNATRVLFGPVSYGAAALCLYGVVVWRWKDGPQRRRLQRVGLWLAVGLIACGVLWVLPYDYPLIHKINLAAMTVSLTAPGLFFLSDCRKDRSLLLFFLGTSLALAVQVGSNTRIRASSGMMLPASIGAMLYLFDSLAAAKAEAGETGRGRWLYRAACAVCAAQLALTCGLRLITVYRESAPLSGLDTRLTAGPARGVMTTADSAAHYDQLLRDIPENAPEDRHTVLVTNLLPMGYLLTDLAPATPSTYNMTMDSGWLSMYDLAHPERRPDYVFVVRDGFGYSNRYSRDGIAFYENNPDYVQKELPSGTAFIRASVFHEPEG